MRLRRTLAGWGRSMLVGALVLLTLTRFDQPGGGAGTLLWPLLFGALYGLAVLGLVRLFRTSGWGLVVAGSVAGPVPLALILRPEWGDGEDRGGMLLIALLIGLAVGLLEWARTRDGEAAVASR